MSIIKRIDQESLKTFIKTIDPYKNSAGPINYIYFQYNTDYRARSYIWCVVENSHGNRSSFAFHDDYFEFERQTPSTEEQLRWRAFLMMQFGEEYIQTLKDLLNERLDLEIAYIKEFMIAKRETKPSNNPSSKIPSPASVQDLKTSGAMLDLLINWKNPRLTAEKSPVNKLTPTKKNAGLN